MTSNTINLVTIMAISELVAGRVAERLAGSGRDSGKIRKRLLAAEDAAVYLGRTKEAVQRLIAAGNLPTVKSDRRVFLEIQDLDRWIDQSKFQ